MAAYKRDIFMNTRSSARRAMRALCAVPRYLESARRASVYAQRARKRERVTLPPLRLLLLAIAAAHAMPRRRAAMMPLYAVSLMLFFAAISSPAAATFSP